jgi:hypothetical protein
MLEIEYGTLIRVHNPDLSGEAHVVAMHGELWLYLRPLPSTVTDEDLYECKSLATGFEHLWYSDEFEAANGEEA